MKKTTLLVTGILVTFLPLAFLFGPRGTGPRAVALGQEPTRTEKVIVLMVDGLRLQESYKFDQFPNAIHAAGNLTPRMTGELFPRGTLYTNAYTGAFNTITTPCVNNLFTGTWHEGPNRGRGLELDDNDFVDNRSFDRSIFEMARRELGLPQTKIAYITDKLNTRISEHSYHPGGGSDLAPVLQWFTTRFNGVEPLGEETFVDPEDNSMVEVLDTASLAMETVEPDLLFLGMGLVDIAGHRAVRQNVHNFPLYAESVVVFDDLLADFWQEIQAHPVYGGKTTLIVCADHGRHEDHDGLAFGEHQGTCRGNREIILLLLGPDTPQGLEVDRRVFQVDVGPTVARLLGHRLPEATGRVLYEGIGITSGLETRAFLAGTDCAIDPAGNVYAVSRSTNRGGRSEILLHKASRGETFGPPVVVASRGARSGTFLDYPQVRVDGMEIGVAAWEWTDANHRVLYHESLDGGATFSPTLIELGTGRTESDPLGGVTLGSQFRLERFDGKDRFFLPTIQFTSDGNQTAIVQFASPRFGDPPDKTTEDAIENVRRVGHHRWIDVLQAPSGDLYGTWSALLIPTNPDLDPFRGTWEVLVKNLSRTGALTPPMRLTDDNIVPDIQPAAAFDPDAPDDRLHLVFASRQMDEFQLYAARSLDLAAEQWTEPVLVTSGPEQAWDPSVVVRDGLVHVAYASYAPGQRGEIQYLALLGESPVGPPVNLSNTAGDSRNPTLLHDEQEGTLVVVWEEETPGSGYRLLKTSITP